MPNSRDELFVGQKATLTRGDVGVAERVTVTPTHHRVPLNEVNVMVDVTGSVATVLVSQLETDLVHVRLTLDEVDELIAVLSSAAPIAHETRARWLRLLKSWRT